MNLPVWLRGHFTPAPDSEVAMTLRRGKSAWTDAVHLLWSLWVFTTPLFGGGYNWQWVGLTALSYPLFLWMYARALLGPRRHGGRYALGLSLIHI